jgi:nicotinamide mononucleotide transporter
LHSSPFEDRSIAEIPLRRKPVPRSLGEAGGQGDVLYVTRINFKTALILILIFSILFSGMWLVLSRLTDSPVPACDSFITSLSIIATWMLARKIYEHWYLWIVVNTVSAVLFITRGLYPTVILYIIYCAMSFAGLAAWKKSLKNIAEAYVR